MRRVDALVGHVDVAPTVLEALGLPAEGGRGVSLLRSAPPAERVLFQSFLPPDEERLEWAATDGRWRAMWGFDGVVRLFDHAQDPREEHDLAAEQPQIAERLKTSYQVSLRGSLEGVQVPMDEAALRDLRALGYAEAAPGEGGK